MLPPEEGAGTQRNEAADGGAGCGENGKLAPEVSTQVVDREESEGQDAAFKCCRQDGADGARDDADDDVRSAHKHLVSFGEW